MIRREIKRIVRFEQVKGKTIEEIEDRLAGCYRIIFTDGTFADLESDPDPLQVRIKLLNPAATITPKYT